MYVFTLVLQSEFNGYLPCSSVIILTTSMVGQDHHLDLPTLTVITERHFSNRNPLLVAIATALGLNAFHVHDPLQVDDHEAGRAAGRAPATGSVDGRNVRTRGVHIWRQGMGS